MPAPNVIFMGSDEFSVPVLEACRTGAGVVAVCTSPDRRSGRGRKRLTRSPVARAADAAGLPVWQPERLDNEFVEAARRLAPDLIIVAAYGLILPSSLLEVPRLDAVNVHASLLPRHRGAAPVAAAILAGDDQTGVTIIRLRPRLDAGEIICYGTDRRAARRATRIGEHETAGELKARLATMGAELLAECLPDLAAGSVTCEDQDESKATYAPMLSKNDGRIDWGRPADDVVRHVRAMTPWPGAFTELRQPGREPLRLIVLSARRAGAAFAADDLPAGQPAILEDGRLTVAAADGPVELRRVKPAGRGDMDARDFTRGHPVFRDGPGRIGETSFAGA
jgi:methionyl-tRNA formyltransferase